MSFGVFLLVAGCGACTGKVWNLEPTGRMRDTKLNESSGVVASRKYKGVLWTHNDDGLAEVFSVNERGVLLGVHTLQSATNRDWEDIAVDARGNLYILDNTSRSSSDFSSTLYVFPEPDPFSSGRVEAARRVTFTFEAGWDTEALFIWQDRAYLVTKSWNTRHPRIYCLEDLERGGAARFVGELPVLAMITGGDIDPGGRRVVLSSYRALFIFEGEADPERLLMSKPSVCSLNARQAEGVSWLGEDLILTNEQRDIFRIDESRWKKNQAPFLRGPEMKVPFVKSASLTRADPKKWPRGTWLRARMWDTRTTIGRVAWSDSGIHIAVQLPGKVTLGSLNERADENLPTWFTPGRIYIMLNPAGDRPLVYGRNDRCLVIGRSPSGEVTSQARLLSVGTHVVDREPRPAWAKLSEVDGHIRVTLTQETPGLGQLEAGNEIGFNLIVIGETRDLFSWTFLTQRFSFDSPSVWGKVTLKR